MNKVIATDNIKKKMIMPVSKKLIAEVGMSEKKLYVCYFKDGLLIVGEPLPSSTCSNVRDAGYVSGFDDGYNEGRFDGGEEAYVEGYHQGYDDAIEGRGYRNMHFGDCGIDCDFECEHCRLRGEF